MIGVLILLAFTAGLMALGTGLLGLVFDIPFTGMHAAVFWTLTFACVALSILALYLSHIDPNIGAQP